MRVRPTSTAEELADQLSAESLLVPVGCPASLDDKGSEDLGQDQAEIAVQRVRNPQTGGELGLDGFDVASKGPLAVGEDVRGPALTGRSLRQIDIGYRYASAAVADEDDTPPEGHDDYVPNAAPGCRAPHLWLDGNRRISTIDLVERNPTVLTTEAGRDWQPAAERAARSIGIKVTTHMIDRADWPDLCGINPTGAVLLRPDGHVAWRRQQLPGPLDVTCAEMLQVAIGRTLALPTRSVAR